MIKPPIRVLCVDDHEFLIAGLRARFELESDIELVGSLNSAQRLLILAQELRPNIILLDIEMPGPDPFEAAQDVHRILPDTRVIILSAYIRDHYISEALKAGAFGYFSKSDNTDEIIGGIRRVARHGEFALGPKIKARCKLVDSVRGSVISLPKTRLESLSPREQEVLRLIGRGMARTQIAETLCRSAKTIDGHREKIMEKLDIHDRGELVRFAIREGLVEA